MKEEKKRLEKPFSVDAVPNEADSFFYRTNWDGNDKAI